MADDSTSSRLAAIEARLDALEAERARTAASGQAGTPAPGTVSEPAAGVDEDARQFWLLTQLERRAEQLRAPGGLVAIVGAVQREGETAGAIRWQQALAGAALAEGDWTLAAETLGALAHPIRLRILQLIYQGVDSVAALTEQPDLGTTGQVHHHLRPLLAAGWVENAGRGRYRVPAARVVPLLSILLAARH